MENNILFIDGVCNLCNNLVKILSRLDDKNILTYASLNSEYAKNHFGENYPEILEANTVIFLKNKSYYTRSEAIHEVLDTLGIPRIFLNSFRLFPLSFRDHVYSWVAKYRYSIFGKSETCQLTKDNIKIRVLK